jgi:hypothetical protein
MDNFGEESTFLLQEVQCDLTLLRLMLGLRCGRALKNQSVGSSKAMRWRTEAMTRKGDKLYDIIRIRGNTLNKNTD